MFLRQCLAFGMVSIREPHLSCKAHSLSCVESQFQQSGASWVGLAMPERTHGLDRTVTMMRLMTMSQKTLSILAEWGTYGSGTLLHVANSGLDHHGMTGSGTGTMGSTMGTRGSGTGTGLDHGTRLGCRNHGLAGTQGCVAL
jgi:hypothetical protein